MGIIYKNRLKSQITLKYRCFWCIVFRQQVFLSFSRQVDCAVYAPIYNDMLTVKWGITMVQKHNGSHRKFLRFEPAYLLSLSWIGGILTGSVLACILKEYSIPLLKLSLDYSVSTIGLVVVLLIPALISYIAWLISRKLIIYACSFLKGICTGHAVLIILFSYGNSAWLLYGLLAFSGIFTLVPVFYLWLTQLNVNRYSLFLNLLYITFATCVGVMDFLLISPCLLTL